MAYTYSIKDPKRLVLNYLVGAPIDSIESDLRRWGYTKEYFQSICVNIKDDHLIKAILDALGIEEGEKRDELVKKNKTLYPLLIALYKEGHYHVKALVKMIEKTKPKKKVSNTTLFLLFASLMTAFGSLFAHFQSERFWRIVQALQDSASSIWRWTKATFTKMRNIALVGLFHSSIGLLFNIYSIATSRTKTIGKKLKGISFAMLQSGFNITAYALTYAAGGIMPPLAGAFYVAASGVDIFKGLVSLWQNYREYKALDEPNDRATFAERANYLRRLSSFRQHRMTLGIKVVFGLVTVGIIALWCFFPAAPIVLAAGCIGGLIATGIAKQQAVDMAKRSYQDSLQEALQNDADAHCDSPVHLLKRPSSEAGKATITKRGDKEIEVAVDGACVVRFNKDKDGDSVSISQAPQAFFARSGDTERRDQEQEVVHTVRFDQTG